MLRPQLTQDEFAQFQRFIYDAAGITMSAAKKALVGGRLARRVEQSGAGSYGDYLRLLKSGGNQEEVRAAIDLLTTNETYFFREPKHFDVLGERASAARAAGQSLRVWSAACSSGEEAYSIAMVLADTMGIDGAWEVLGTDISTRVLHKARLGHYPLDRARNLSDGFLRRYCLKGTGPQEGTLLVAPALRRRVQFGRVNLNEALPHLGQFDLVFLRNVMIYFSPETKRTVVERIVTTLKTDGMLVIGHAESLGNITGVVAPLVPSLYRRAG